jgi:acetyl esterase/lipase
MSATTENNSGYYFECNGIFSLADHYLPRSVPLSHQYIWLDMQSINYLKGVLKASGYTSRFDLLKDVDVDGAVKLEEVGVEVTWTHYEGMTHGWLQIGGAWSK